MSSPSPQSGHREAWNPHTARMKLAEFVMAAVQQEYPYGSALLDLRQSFPAVLVTAHGHRHQISVMLLEDRDLLLEEVERLRGKYEELWRLAIDAVSLEYSPTRVESAQRIRELR